MQAGLRYRKNYTGMRTYYETKISGVHNLQEVGYHVLDFSAQYKVEYQSDGKWHAYIGPYDKGGVSLGFSSAGVQAQAEAHASDIELGPFEFTSVTYKNSSGSWVYMDVTPKADSPFSVSIVNDYTYTAY